MRFAILILIIDGAIPLCDFASYFEDLYHSDMLTYYL